jgi:hypothetical protein
MTALRNIAPALQRLNASLTAAAKAFASLIPDYQPPEPKPQPRLYEFDYHGIKLLATIGLDGKIRFWRRV